MIDKIIEHLSNEIQKIMETTMTFRTRIAFIAWIGPFIILSSLVVSTKGLFRIPADDALFFGALAASCSCYLVLAYISGRLEKQAWERCNVLRRKIKYAKQEWPKNISDSDFVDVIITQNVRRVYMWAFVMILISFMSVSVVISRIEAKTPADGERAASVPWRTGPHCPPATASPNPPSGKLGASAAENEEVREPNKRIDGDKR